MKLTKALTLGFAALVTLAQIAKAGPPLICHALNIGGAKSLPWNNDMWSLSGKTDYDLSRLVADTLELLAPNAPVRFTATVNKPLTTGTPGTGSLLPICVPPLGGEPEPWASHRLNCMLQEPLNGVAPFLS